MAKLNYEKRNRLEKAKRQQGEKIRKPKKATAKQKEAMKKLKINFNNDINRITASHKIKTKIEEIKASKTSDR